MKTMSAKFAGKCRTCGGRIEAGDTIRWGRAEGANHLDCHAVFGTQAEWNEYHAEAALVAREEAEYLRGYHEVAQIQASFPPGPWRDAAYAEMEMAAYNRGEDY